MRGAADVDRDRDVDETDREILQLPPQQMFSIALAHRESLFGAWLSSIWAFQERASSVKDRFGSK